MQFRYFRRLWRYTLAYSVNPSCFRYVKSICGETMVSENAWWSLLMCSACRRQALDGGGGLSKDFRSSCDLCSVLRPFLLRRQRVAYTYYPSKLCQHIMTRSKIAYSTSDLA
jgi:hypothetical protein